MSHLEWRHDGRRLVIPIALRLADAGLDLTFHRGRAQVDTGATNSGINVRIAASLGMEGIGKRPLKNAHEERQTQRYIFQIGVFPDVTADESTGLPYWLDDVDGFELGESFELDALIGMDILSQCDLQIDRRRRCLLSFGHGV